MKKTWKRKTHRFDRRDGPLLGWMATMSGILAAAPFLDWNPALAVLGALLGSGTCLLLALSGSYVYLPRQDLVKDVDGILWLMRSRARGKELTKDPDARRIYQQAVAQRNRYVLAVSAVARDRMRHYREAGAAEADALVAGRLAALKEAQQPFYEALAAVEDLLRERSEARGDTTPSLAEEDALTSGAELGQEARRLREEVHNLRTVRKQLREE